MMGLAAAVFVAVAVGGVFTWQHAQVRERDHLLATTQQERDQARLLVESLEADASRSDAQIQTLETNVVELTARVDKLRSRVDRLQGQSAVPLVCTASDLLSAVRAQVDIAEPMVFDAVSIQECGGGYARVYAQPGNVPAGSNVDSEQVFLRYEQHEWIVIASGTGITCSDQDLSGDVEQACAALGLA